MTKINGISYVMIGVAVALMSWFSNARTGSNSMTVFIFIGILFVVVGIIKLIVKFIQKQNYESKHPVQKHRAQSHNHPPIAKVEHHSPHHPQHTQHHKTFPAHRVCPNCHARNNLDSNFCMRCGYGLKR